MRVGGEHLRTILEVDGGRAVSVIDQTRLPAELAWVRLERADEAARAIGDMVVRGAPLVGVTAAYGLALALREDPSDAALERARRLLLATRPTAVNLRWAVD
ncbi:MAG: S-methyl-5-thioribose-1-phosphate isomerase, partial [Gemmatimonadales bacterium]